MKTKKQRRHDAARQVEKNAVHVIHPYVDRRSGLWVFDDPARELEKEPFIPITGAVIDAWLRSVSGRIRPAQFSLMFSQHKFPDAQIALRVLHDEDAGRGEAGTWYEAEWMDPVDGQRREHLWLCPALLKFFPKGAPKVIHAAMVRAPAIGEGDV